MTINLQHILSAVALLTYGFTDSFTSAMMMKLRGPYIESNPIISYIYTVQGFWGVIIFKLLAVFIFIAIIYEIQGRYNMGMCWKINGLFISVSIIGILSTIANIKALDGIPFIEPSMAILLYMIMVICSIYVGDYIDDYTDKERREMKG